MNWRTGFTHTNRRQFVVLGEAYFSSAYNLVQQCLENNRDKKADSWIFPIMFNVVHGIEVYLKAINCVLSIILSKEKGITEGGHDIRALCATARNLIIEHKTANRNTTTEQMFSAIKLVEKFVLNIYDKTDDMTFARYPLAKNKQGHFYVQKFRRALRDRIDTIYQYAADLDYSGLCEELEITYTRPKIMHQHAYYQLEKIFCYLNDNSDYGNIILGRQQAHEFSKKFAKKWVKIDAEKMSFEEIKLLVSTACYLEHEEQEAAK